MTLCSSVSLGYTAPSDVKSNENFINGPQHDEDVFEQLPRLIDTTNFRNELLSVRVRVKKSTAVLSSMWHLRERDVQCAEIRNP